MVNDISASGSASRAGAGERIGVLVVNLGTPRSPRVWDVALYLRTFLMDKWVLTMSWWLRSILVTGILLLRSRRSAHAYRMIWRPEGSPLMIHHLEFCRNLQTRLSDKESQAPSSLVSTQFMVETAMRYGEPSIEGGVSRLLARGISKVIVYPQYPQYSESATRSVLEEVARVWRRKKISVPKLEILDFHDDPQFIEAWAGLIGSRWREGGFDHLVYSFHSLPESHVRKLSSSCLTVNNCCEVRSEENKMCYRSQCVATAKLLTQKLGLDSHQCSFAFQSRMGRAKWIEPTTEHTLVQLAQRGAQRVLLAAPSFTSDCLETLEELKIRAAEVFREAGGHELVVLPALNSSSLWVNGAAEKVKKVALNY